jgi:glycosyltransferase involved in cell wall biosynthesis
MTPYAAARLPTSEPIGERFHDTDRAQRHGPLLGAPEADRLRVLLLHNVIAPYRLPLFDALGASVDLHVVFCTRDVGPRRWSTDIGSYRFRHTVLPSLRAGRLVLSFGLARLLRQPYDVYIAADNGENALSILMVLLVARLRRKPLLVWSEHVQDTRPVSRLRRAYRQVKRACRRRVYSLATGMLSMSGERTDAYLLANGVPRSRIFTNTQVMPRALLPAPDRAAREGPRPYFLYLGYLRVEKAVDVLIRAFREAAHLDVDLVVAGSGPEQARLEALSQGDPRIRFAGYVEGARKASLISGAMALVLPSWYEPWGMVVNEALFYGRPVICSDAVAACVLIEPGVNGLIVGAGDVAALRGAIELIGGDTQLRERLAANTAKLDRDVIAGADYGIRHFLEAIADVTQRRVA